MPVPEAPLRRSATGLVPEGRGWFVVNARDAVWKKGNFGRRYTSFRGAVDFEQLGINIGVLEPGQPSCMYHREGNQENFLVLSGECLLLVEGEERRLRAWDFVHCPPWTEHAFVGAADGLCVILAVGARAGTSIVYPHSELALRHGAGVEQEVKTGEEAYADMPARMEVPYEEGWLP